MNRDVTTPIPFLSDAEAARAQERLARLCGPLDATQDRIDTSGSLVGEDRIAHPAALGRGLVVRRRSCSWWLISGLRRRTPFRARSPVGCPPGFGGGSANGNGMANRELPVADFMEPVEYGWTETAFEARQALRRYSEETHADY